MKFLNFINETAPARTLRFFNLTSTGMPYYDEMLESPSYFERSKHLKFSIVYMTPDQYIRECGMNRTKTISYNQELQAVVHELIDKYKQRSLAGEKMPLLVLDKARNEQEGRHRAMVAKALGLNAVPVMVVEKTT